MTADEQVVSSAQERAAEVRECIEIMGGLMRSADRTDPRVDRPLTQQLKALVDASVASKPEFRRTVPMQWDDTDLLICSVLAKLLDIASANLLVDDDTARLVALGRAVEAMGQLPVRGDADYRSYAYGHNDCLGRIYRKVLFATDRPPDSPAQPETPSEGTPVPPEPSEGDTGADSPKDWRNSTPSVDVMLAWLRARGDSGRSGAIDLIEPADPEGWTAGIWVIDGVVQDVEYFTAPTLLAALEAAVRAVAGEDEQ